MDGVGAAVRPFGLSASIRESLREVFTRFSKIDRVMVYGSRATGRYRPQSDIDLAVIAPDMSDREFSLLWMALDDLPILFRLDVSLWHQVTNATLQQAMLRDGVNLYEADSGRDASVVASSLSGNAARPQGSNACRPEENAIPSSGFVPANQMNPQIISRTHFHNRVKS